MSSSISREDWLKALEEAQATDRSENADAITAQEYSELTGVHVVTARRQLPLLVKKGMAEQVEKWVQRVDGSWVRFKAYRLKGRKK